MLPDALRRKWAPMAAVLLVAIGSARIVSTYPVFNHTIDEPDTLAAGMEYLTTGKYLYEDTHPPLGRVFAAIGPYLAGERFHPGPNSYFEGYRILGHDAHYDRVLALARLGNLPFFWIGSLVVYLWAARARGAPRGASAALVAVLVYTTIPPVLAHAGLATTDMALGVMTPAAALAAVCWAERPDRRRSLAFGALLALACVSKFSAILFLPAGCLAMWLCHRTPATRSHWKALALVVAAAALVVWTVYGFSFARVEFLHLRLPAPRFFSGIHSVYIHNQSGHPSYLLGRRSPNGFWYYFPVVLALKTPLALLLLVAAAAATLFRGAGPRGHPRFVPPATGAKHRRWWGGQSWLSPWASGPPNSNERPAVSRNVFPMTCDGLSTPQPAFSRRFPGGRPADSRQEPPGGALELPAPQLGSVSGTERTGVALPLAFAAGVLVVAMTGHIDIGVRYLLPVYAGLAVAAGCLAATLRGALATAAVAALLAWQIVSGALRHPDYLPYTNELAGSHPEQWISDSDLDWGQDMKRLGDFLARRGVTQLTFAPFNRTYLWAGHALPPLQPGDTDHPSPGWNAVSITIWKVFGYPKWADTAPPPQRIGSSILVWYVKE
ncbi:MAG: glycosyltransferase family 39 protein [Bryobacteraceae bacterium]